MISVQLAYLSRQQTFSEVEVSLAACENRAVHFLFCHKLEVTTLLIVRTVLPDMPFTLLRS